MPVLAGAGWYNGLGFLIGTAHGHFEIFVKAMPPSLSELKVLPSFCFAFKISDDVTATNKYIHFVNINHFLRIKKVAST